MQYFLVVLGCQMNQSDAERVHAIMGKMGFSQADKEEQASVIGVIACSVRQKAIDKVYSKISKWNRWKRKCPLITFVSGCILPDDHRKFLQLFDLVFDMKELSALPMMLAQYGVSSPLSGMATPAALHESIIDKGGRTIFTGLKPVAKQKQPPQTWEVEPVYNSRFEAFIPIQNGCNKFCTYCAVPYTRGREVSRPSAEIISEVRSLVTKGYRSITLLGQNVNSYGLDRKGNELSFAQLLHAVGAISDSQPDVWIYFTSPHPLDMTRDVIETIASHPSLAKQIHLPIQSGDDEVLERMNRRHTVARYREVAGWIRELLPTATLFTDIIVGFSGETDAQFENTRNAVREFGYNMAYIAMYSPRPGAASFQWSDNVPHTVKKQRYATLTGDLEHVAARHTNQLAGTTVKMLVRGYDRKPGYLTGHTEGRIVVRFPSTDDTLIGAFANVTIESATPFSVEGTLAK
ncbi:MAG: MiaB/RimO family radical SAM methylthiotransferase [Cytophagaceae bacterium]|nr:MiaB/RimO family radical SAM methylthiotransferase [Cytophagaceae bacterium]